MRILRRQFHDGKKAGKPSCRPALPASGFTIPAARAPSTLHNARMDIAPLARHILTPSQLGALARDLLEGSFPMVWVEGDLGGV
jgi:hypothetical protein